MNPFTRFMRKLSIFLGRRQFLNELDEEMAFHRAQAAEEFIAGGMRPEAISRRMWSAHSFRLAR